MSKIKIFWKQLHWSLRTLFALMLLTLAYAGIGFLGVPALGEYLLEHQAAQALGKPVAVERIRYNPFTWKLDLYGVTVAGENPDSADLAVERIGADMEFSNLHKGVLAVDDITLQGVQVRPGEFDLPAAPVILGLNGLDGALSLHMERTGEEGTWSPVLSGRVALNGVTVRDPKQEIILSLGTLRAGLKKFNPATNTVTISRVALTEPYARAVRHKDGTLNLASLAGPPKQDDSKRAHSGSPVHFSVAEISVNGGRVLFEDQSSDRAVITEVTSLSLHMDNLSDTPNSTAHLQAGLQTKAGESLSLEGTLGLTPFMIEGTIQAADIPVPAYAPYYEQALPFTVASGTLEAKTRFRVDTDGTDLLQLSGIHAGLVDLQMNSEDSDTPFFTLSSMDVKGGEVSLGGRRVSVASIRLGKGNLRMTRNQDGSLNLVEMFSRGSDAADHDARSAPSEPDPTAASWKVTTGRVDLADFALHLQDDAAPRPGTLSVPDLDLTLKNIDSSLTAPVSLDIAATLDRGGRIRTAGTVVPDTLTGSGTFDLAGVDVRSASMYIPETVRLSLRSGTLQGKGTWDLGSENEFALRAGADISLAGFAAGENGRPDRLLGLGNLTLNRIDFRLSGPSLSIGTISMEEPYADLVVDETGTLNLVRILGGSNRESAPSASDTNKEHAPFALTVNRVTVDRGLVKFRDETFAPAMATSLHDITGDVSTLTLGSPEPAEVTLKAGIDGRAPLIIEGRAAPFAEQLHTDLTMTLSDLDMVTLSPYLRKYLAYPVSKGQLSWESSFLTRENRLTGSNRFRFKRFVLGDKVDSPDAPNVPVKLALSLLQDGEGNMELDVPVEGNLDDPGFRIGGVIIQAVIGVFRNILTAPFSIIGSMFGGGEDVSTVPFEPGRADLGEIARQKLTTVAKALKERPGLRIDLTGHINPEADRLAVTERRLQSRVKGLKFSDLEKTGRAPAHIRDVEFADREEYLKYLGQTYLALHPKAAPGTLQTLTEQDLEAGIRAAVTVPDHDLKALADQRTAVVQSHLIKDLGVSPEQVFRRDEAVAPKEKGQAQVKLSLHG
jgi:hypothetical protein